MLRTLLQDLSIILVGSAMRYVSTLIQRKAKDRGLLLGNDSQDAAKAPED